MKKIIYDLLVDLYYLLLENVFSYISDEIFIKCQYFIFTHKRLNIKNPVSYNEKIQWLKLYDRRPEYSSLADKYEVKRIASSVLGKEHIIPTIGIYNSFNDIDFDVLPEKFVMKSTHDSGGIVICQDKSKLDINKTKKFLNKHLKRNYYWHSREWAYKNIKPRIIIEPYMVDDSETELKDYKIFCFDGVAKLIQVDYGRFKKHMRNLYTTDWRYLAAQIKYPKNSEHQIEKPSCLEELIRCAEKMSAGLIHARVDFYIINNIPILGEVTLNHGSGYEKFTPEEFGIEMGSFMHLRK